MRTSPNYIPLTQELLEKIIRYDRAEGILYWLERENGLFINNSRNGAWNSRWAGKQAGNLAVNGYVYVRLLGKCYKAHRLIWLLEHGTFPEFIDHINGERSDNRIENLRSVSKSENSKNARLYSNNKTGAPGIVREARCTNRPWSVTVTTADGVRKRIGYFATLEEAIEVRLREQQNFGYHENHART